ncbi:hypothetical protein [Bradyrhizobium sp. Gha]|uniref:hypothetical protein n=1 Tax=Bradyrhizobium sp. Gha TaxID=1855318 RepID=UPI001FCDA728|nr:hypothetical protein [Bradyrhizobium sp. Gha]
MEADRLQRGRIAIRKTAPGQFVETCRCQIDRDLGSAEHDLAQLVELASLLMMDETGRGEVTCQAKRSRARKDERRQHEVWPP